MSNTKPIIIPQGETVNLRLRITPDEGQLLGNLNIKLVLVGLYTARGKPVYENKVPADELIKEGSYLLTIGHKTTVRLTGLHHLEMAATDGESVTHASRVIDLRFEPRAINELL